MTPDVTTILLSRIQFGFTVSLHITFPAFIGLAMPEGLGTSLFDARGLIVKGGDDLDPSQQAYARDGEPTTELAEAAERIDGWTDGKGLVACGVQFPDATVDGKTFRPGQGQRLPRLPIDRPRRPRDRAEADRRRDVGPGRARHRQPGEPGRPRRRQAVPEADGHLQTEITTATRVAESILDRGQATVERPRNIRAWLQAMTDKPTCDGAT